jgi:hypothetical protein
MEKIFSGELSRKYYTDIVIQRRFKQQNKFSKDKIVELIVPVQGLENVEERR